MVGNIRNGEIAMPKFRSAVPAPASTTCFTAPRVAIVALVLSALAPVMASGATPGWSSWGNGIFNRSHAPDEVSISPANVAELQVKWTFATEGTPIPTPTIEGDALYLPDFAGNLYRLSRSDGSVTWQRKLSEYTGRDASRSRTSPAIGEKALVIGDATSATVIGVDKATGEGLWTANLGRYGGGFVISSPVIHDGVAYMGVSSFDEVTSLLAGDRGPTFRGSIAAVDVETGEVLWQTPTQPEGYFGGAVWSSTPVVDARRGALYVSVGDTYKVPDEVAACMNAASSEAKKDACLSPLSAGDGLMALDLRSGAIRWVRRAMLDTWNIYCGYPTGRPNQGGHEHCQVKGYHFDYDFGSGPNMLNDRLVGAGQKSGVYHAFDAETGAIVWSTSAGPGGLVGGIQFGTATDGTRIYVPETNFDRDSYVLADGTTWDAGSWAALDPATGAILWQTPAPTPPGATEHALAQSGMSVANGVLYGGTLSGEFVAMNAANGEILWRYESGGSVHAAPAIVDGVLYWTSGYTGLGATDNQRLYAFSLPGD